MIKANKEETHLNDRLEGWFWCRIPIPRCLTPVPPAPPPAPVFPTLPHPQTPRSPVCLPATPAGPGGAVGDTNRKIFQVMSHNLGTTIVPTLHSLGNVTASGRPDQGGFAAHVKYRPWMEFCAPRSKEIDILLSSEPLHQNLSLPGEHTPLG